MKSMRGAISILWAVAWLGVPGCEGGGDEDTGASGSTGMEMDGSTGSSNGSEGSTTTNDPTTTGVDSSSGGPPIELSCESYCEIYSTACPDFSEYANDQHCLDHCGQWPEGAPEDVDGDSLGCRTYHATVAGSTDPDFHCPHAGPSGAAVCVAEDAPTCDLYCTRYFGNCTDDLNLWVDMDECLTECATWYPGTTTDDSGNTIGCRAYYANLAAGDPDTHCPNAGPGGGEACVFP
ncbi:hypothetical protein [Paraliomyxa miuraensis]|uniref:hypothetical protein n=1 Tax=Paraliomyxa miuraensis TaxID=376150 RepID=UPI002258F6A3|nr:hypothetical protein [Paraliomyxa miuraensis]MCX4244509.1 hypothetical protein [Paraliomyxa miuraensis]